MIPTFREHGDVYDDTNFSGGINRQDIPALFGFEITVDHGGRHTGGIERVGDIFGVGHRGAECHRRPFDRLFLPVPDDFVGDRRTEVLITDADITSWLPGDSLFDDRVFLPPDLPEGEYELQLGIVDPQTRKPRVRLAIEDRNDEGWYPMGTITVEDGPFQVGVERDLDTP